MTSTSNFPDDPWDWSVDQVVEALCLSTQWWKDGRPNNSALPEPVSFAKSLREQDVDGSTLLSLDHQILKDDLNIRSIGNRNAVLLAVRQLRERSVKYQEHAPMPAGFMPPGLMHPMPPSMAVHSQTLNWLQSTPTTIAARSIPPVPPFDTDAENIESSAAGADIGAEAANTRMRAGETLFEDGLGRKRRRIALQAVSKLIEGEPSRQESSSAMPQQLPGVSDTKRFPVDNIFHGDVAFGHALKEDKEFDIEHYSHAPPTPGDAQYVYRQVHHFFQRLEHQEIVRNGQHALAVYPYRESVLGADQPRSATLIRLNKNKTSTLATRELSSRLTTDLPYEETPGPSHYDWDYLAEKYRDNTELPPLGESDTENEYSASLIAELEEEEDDSDKSKPRQLGKQEVSEIIDQRLEEFAQSWKEKKLPLRERKARGIWCRRERERKWLITAAKAQIEKINRRLNKLKEAILDDVWSTPAQVREQCGSLQESISQKEEELWRISVWERKTGPLRLKTKVPSWKKPIKIGDDVLVDSDSEVDGPENFIDTDDVTMEGLEVSLSPSSHCSGSLDEPSVPTKNVNNAQDPIANLPEDSVLRDTTGSDDEVSEENKLRDADAGIPGVEEESPIDRHSTPAPPSSPPDLPTPHAPPRLLTTPAHPATSVIDLTLSSDPPTPELRQLSAFPAIQPTTTQRYARFSGLPEKSSISDIESWSYRELEERSDRKRLILKILRTEVSKERRLDMKEHISTLHGPQFPDYMSGSMETLLHRENSMVGQSEEERTVTVEFVKLYMCWINCKHKHFKATVDALYPYVLKLHKICGTPATKADMKAFFRWVQLILAQEARVIKRSPVASPLATPVPEELSDDEEAVANTPHRKRKRKVEKSASAINLRQDAQKRRQAQAEREKVLERMTSSRGGSVNPGGVLVNIGKEEEGAICIHSSVSNRIKSHQVDGVRFMWREVINAGHDEPQGCLLAHTMGLGKTMQAITFLAIVADAAQSTNEAVRTQIPESLRESRTLIICPASLISNWADELYYWIPKSIKDKVGDIYCIDAEMRPEERLRDISEWYEDGGVLVISYDMLRNLAQEGEERSALGQQDRKRARKQLLEGPNIIIADEAHHLKDPLSKIRKAVGQFRSKSRIALTGSPLANNLEEYWSTLDWISPGYLGSLTEFRAHFVEPIQEGFYRDSTKHEHRRALKKLKVLKNEIEPKVHRADITVLKDTLKPKVEFVITVPLTELQEEAYKICVRHMRTKADEEVRIARFNDGLVGNTRKKEAQISNARLWEWASILTLLCDHPAAFAAMLSKAKADKRRRGSNTGVEEEESLAEDPDTLQEKLLATEEKGVSWMSPSLVKEMQDLFNKFGGEELVSPRHSYKTEIFIRILNHAKKADDRVLVFTHRLDTLDYLEDLLERLKRRFVRLDGKTKMSNRPEILRDFNDKHGGYDIMLVSTRAGGTGFNLPGANRVVIFDFGFNPQHEEQAIGRAYRIGQKKEVFVYRLIAGGTFEVKVWNKALFKTQLASRVVDTKNPERQADKMKDYLFDPSPVEQQDLTEHEGKDKLILDKILAKSQESDIHIRSITTTETLMLEDIEGNLDVEEEREVQEMIRDEKLRKRDPEAYSQRLQARQAAALSAASNAPSWNATAFPSTAPATYLPPQPPTPFRAPPSARPPSSTQFLPPHTADTLVDHRSPTSRGRHGSGSLRAGISRSEGLPSSDAGVNNAAPSPARMPRSNGSPYTSQTTPQSQVRRPVSKAPLSSARSKSIERYEMLQSPDQIQRRSSEVPEDHPSSVHPIEDDEHSMEVMDNTTESNSSDDGDFSFGSRITGWLTGFKR